MRTVLSHSQRRAFSLVELLVVLAIIALVASFVLPSVMGVFSTYQLDSTGQIVVNQLTFARQTALSQGHAVEVRFYLLPDYNAALNATPTVYRGMQSFLDLDPVVSSTSTTTPTSAIVKPTFFHAPVVISTGTSTVTNQSVSPILPANTNLSTPGNNAADPANPLTGFQSNYQYVMFHFKADGSTDLTQTLNSFSLVLEGKKANATTGLPSNFQTITIDPLSGTIKSYRP